MQSKPIFNSYIAKQLIRMGNRVVDIQPDKKNENGIILFFEINEKFNNDLTLLSHDK